MFSRLAGRPINGLLPLAQRQSSLIASCMGSQQLILRTFAQQRLASTANVAGPKSTNSLLEKRETEATELEKQDELTRRQLELSKEKVAMKRMKPTSPGLRWWRKPIYPYLWRGRPYKPLTVRKVDSAGRNRTGRITVRHRGGGHQKRIRLVDYTRMVPGRQKVLRIEYDRSNSSSTTI